MLVSLRLQRKVQSKVKVSFSISAKNGMNFHGPMMKMDDEIDVEDPVVLRLFLAVYYWSESFT